MSTLTTDPPVSNLDQNIPCLRCGYNLRTVSPDARCPECSTPISSSLNPTLLRYDDPSWIRVLSLSLGLLLLACIVQLFYTVALLLLPEPGIFLPHGSHPFETADTFAKLLGSLAVFLLGAPNPQLSRPERLFSIRRLMRLSASLSFAMVFLLDVELWDTSLNNLWEIPLDDIFNTLTTSLTLLYLLQLAKKSGLPRLVLQSRIAVIVIPLCALLAIVYNYYSTALERAAQFETPIAWLLIAAAAYEICLYFLFRRTLRKCVSFARQYWHFCSPIPLNTY